VRAWYGEPRLDLESNSEWETTSKKGKIVTNIVHQSLCADGALDFNPTKRECNNFFGDPCFGYRKILAVEYRYGNRPAKMWISPSHIDGEPYACFLPAREVVSYEFFCVRQRCMRYCDLMHVV